MDIIESYYVEIICFGIALIVGVPLYIFSQRQSKRRESIRARLRRELADLEQKRAVIDVRYCSNAKFRRVVCKFVEKIVGIMIIGPDSVELRIESEDGKRRERLEFLRGRDTVDFIKKTWWTNATHSWISLGLPGGERHYITLDFGMTPGDSALTTQKIARYICNTLHQDRCLKCNYSLANNVTGVCPECGEPFTLPGHSVF